MAAKVTKVFGGIEGGGTKTLLSLVDSAGRLVGSGQSGPSNPWLLSKNGSGDQNDGFLSSAKLINALIEDTLAKCADEANRYELASVALCLSGGGTKIAKDFLIQAFEKKLNVNYQVHITNDAFAALFTAFPNGGVVIISGTGSNCVLVNPLPESVSSIADINFTSSGGWGCHLGDEGSGFWISKKLIKYLIEVNDGLLRLKDQNSIDLFNELKSLVFEHFEIKEMKQILPYFYSGNQNHLIASLTSKLVKVAEDREENVVSKIFAEAGYELARQLVALEPKIDNALKERAHGLPVVCTGSVFKSWRLLRQGFRRGLAEADTSLERVHLVTIKGNDSTLGAAYLAKKLSLSNDGSSGAEQANQDLELIILSEINDTRELGTR